MEASFWRRLWTCRQTEYWMNEDGQIPYIPARFCTTSVTLPGEVTESTVVRRWLKLCNAFSTWEMRRCSRYWRFSARWNIHCVDTARTRNSVTTDFDDKYRQSYNPNPLLCSSAQAITTFAAINQSVKWPTTGAGYHNFQSLEQRWLFSSPPHPNQVGVHPAPMILFFSGINCPEYKDGPHIFI